MVAYLAATLLCKLNKLKLIGMCERNEDDSLYTDNNRYTKSSTKSKPKFSSKYLVKNNVKPTELLVEADGMYFAGRQKYYMNFSKSFQCLQTVFVQKT